MPFRVSTASNFARMILGMQVPTARLVRAQEQIASGRSILRPSDDPVGALRTLSLNERLAEVARFRGGIASGLPFVETASASLSEASALLTDARERVLQGMNGSLSQSDREALATEIEQIRDELLELANVQVGDRYLFGGTRTDAAPWVVRTIGGFERAVYVGDGGEHRVRIGNGLEVALNVPGSTAFGELDPTGTSYAGLTGLAGGATADEGTAYEYVELRHDATVAGALASVGIALVDGGAADTLLGDHELVIDPAGGTVRLGDGPPRNLPDPADPEAADFVVANALGGELHLDLGGWTGAALTETVHGAGSISIDGETWTALAFDEADLALRNDATGAVLHVDTTGVGRAGRELASFTGASNVFDVLQGVADDLRNADGLAASDVAQRLELRLDELDRGHDDLLVSLGVLGERGGRLRSTDERLVGVDLQLRTFLSETRDADYAEVVADLVQAEQTLQAAQAAGARLIRTTLLEFLR